MKFNQVLLPGTLLRRYQRFLADVRLDDGRRVTAHTPNTGAMLGCCEPGARVWLSDSGNPGRKYPLGWELVETAPGALTGVNTGLANRLIAEGIENGVVTQLQGYDSMRREVRYGRENSRIDLLLEGAGRPACYVEIKNVTLARDGVGYFPDAVSERGSRHLRELAAVAAQGQRGVICFCAQRRDVHEIQPADEIDRRYGDTLRQVLEQGVEAIAWRADVSTEEIVIAAGLPVNSRPERGGAPGDAPVSAP